MAAALKVIALVHLLVISVVLASFPERKLDCSTVDAASLLTYQDMCHYVTKWDVDLVQKLGPVNRLDIVETCTCNLLRHTIVWQAMLSHEVETLFFASRELVKKNSDEDVNELRKTNLVLQSDPSNNMYYWDHLDLILRQKASEVDASKLSKTFMDIFANIYYNPESLKLPYQDNPSSMSLVRVLSKTCKQLVTQFGPFLNALGNLRQLTDNPRYVYRMVSYDESLYKLMGATKMCQFMAFAGELI